MDLSGLFRDTAVVDVLMQSLLPAQSAALTVADVELLWLTTDYFMTLGAKAAPLSLVCTIWDLCFLHGPPGVFAAFLALVSLRFKPRANEDATLIINDFREASRSADPCKIAREALRLLCKGVSDRLILELRGTLTLGQSHSLSYSTYSAGGELMNSAMSTMTQSTSAFATPTVFSRSTDFKPAD
jgi:hypothetical protein